MSLTQDKLIVSLFNKFVVKFYVILANCAHVASIDSKK